MTTPSYFPAAKWSRSVRPDIKAALIGLTRILPIPCRNTNIAYVVKIADGSSLTALPIATRIVLNPKPKKPYVRLNMINKTMDLAKPQKINAAAAAATQQAIARVLTEKLLSDK